MRRQSNHEEDLVSFPADTYSCKDFPGVAFRVLGWEIGPALYDEDLDGYSRSGKVAIYMVGDDKVWYVDPEDISPIEEDAYCHECGQIGCRANVTG